jgi:protein TonB
MPRRRVVPPQKRTPRLNTPPAGERALLAGRTRLGMPARPLRGSDAATRRAAFASVVLHAFLALMIGAAIWFDPSRMRAPDEHAYVDLIIGTNATVTGGAASATPMPQMVAASPPPAPPMPPQPAPAPPQPDASAARTPPADVAAPPAPDGSLPAPAPPPAALAQPAAEAPPQPPPPAPDSKPGKDAAQQASPGAETSSIRVGDGLAGAYAELDDIGRLHAAQPEDGNIPPEYPIEAARRGEQGVVVLRIFIAKDGHVMRVDVARSSGSASLDETARDRIATWRFHPATRDGKPVASVEEQNIRFEK